MLLNKDTLRKNKQVLAVVLSLITLSLAIFFGYIIGDYSKSEKVKKYVDSIKNIREETDSRFISPLIGSASSPSTDIGIYSNAKKTVSAYLTKELKNGELEDFSFYFKDLNTPFWFGINEQASFVPASLYKLPVAIAVYKQAEVEGDAFLRKTVLYTQEIDAINQENPENEAARLSIGSSYTVEDLVNIMLKESDNGAKNLLISAINQKHIVDLFSLLNISIGNQDGYVISSMNYAHFLRVLYNASYLSPQHSESILAALVLSDFKDGLVAGVPRNIQVAHKFGTYPLEENNMTYFVLHDCGIVYHAENPYVVCLMTKGKNIDHLYSIIGNVSKILYETQNSNNR
jgi:beta-lactamase class A